MLPSRQDPSAVLAEAVAAPLRQSLLERPGVAPAGLRSLLRDLGVPYVSNGVIGFIFSASGPLAVTLAVGTAGGLTEGQLASWVFGILFSGGAATLVMSLLYRQPLGFAWSIPGTVLLGPSLQHLSFPEVVGAFFTSGILVLALGATGVVRRIMAVVPMPIVMAMVAAVFLKFGTDVVTSTQANPVVAAPMVIVFLVLTAVPALGRVLPPVLGTLAIGCVAVAASGQFSFHGARFWPRRPSPFPSSPGLPSSSLWFPWLLPCCSFRTAKASPFSGRPATLRRSTCSRLFRARFRCLTHAAGLSQRALLAPPMRS